MDDRAGMPSPTVTVILTVYNQAPFIGTAVESVLTQTFTDWELIAIDNGSTDDSPQVLSRYRSDPRVRVCLYDKNESLSLRFNSAIRDARGSLVTFLYGDDWFLPHKLDRQVKAFASLSARYGVVYGPALGHNEQTGAQWLRKSIAASGDIFESLIRRLHSGRLDMSSPMTRRECFIQHAFDESIFAETEAVFLRIALTHHFHYVDEPLVVLRDHGQNAGKAIIRNCDLVQRALANLRANPHLRVEDNHLVDACEASLMLAYGWQGARLNADTAWSRARLARAVRLAPRTAFHPKFAAAVVLLTVPPSVRPRVNRLGHRLRAAPGNAAYVDDYVSASRVPN